MLFRDKYDFVTQYKDLFTEELGHDFEHASNRDRYLMLARLVAHKARIQRAEAARDCRRNERKQVYYFSMEFLIGRLLENYLLAFGAEDVVREGLKDLGCDLDVLKEEENDPGLGNGGLGRLAACFVDAMATMGLAGHGNGIRYRYGLFRQEIQDHAQVEKPDHWLGTQYPWEIRKPENAVVVRFGGHVERHEENGKFWFTWEGGERVLAVPYDVPVVGAGGETVNTLRLWSAEPYEEAFDMDAFNRGDYSGAMKFRSDVEAITYILYPNDNADPGKVLRLKQEYLFVAAGLNNILRSFKKDYGCDWKRFPELVAIHTNDTHPALCAPELLRILIDEEGLDWDTAWYVVKNSISYTNHTILPEALEKWPIDMFRSLLPRVYTFVEEIDRRYRESFPRDKENWQELLKNTAILWDGQVRMANLSVIAGHSVNGVAALHTEILKERVLKDFYTLTPEKFNNKTNGVSHRRFLVEANPSLSRLITSAIGEDWKDNADWLKALEAFKTDAAFLEKLGASKRENKVRLSNYVKDVTGIALDPDAMFDVQVKRFHAYKRQLLNLFKVMDLYNRITEDSSFRMQPTAFLFAGKAAQGYAFAKDVIRLINTVAEKVNADPRARDMLRLAFIPNFSVSNGQLIYPAAEISEQISTAGMEASGTGNMKFMFNGAITLGTLDGANVEIAEHVGKNNIEIFGLRAEEVEHLRSSGNYFAWDECSRNSERLGKVVNQLCDGTYGDFQSVYDNLLHGNDEFFVLRDFQSYLDGWHHLEKLYADREAWNSISLHNIANAAFFSSDRTVSDYAREIWHAPMAKKH